MIPVGDEHRLIEKIRAATAAFIFMNAVKFLAGIIQNKYSYGQPVYGRRTKRKKSALYYPQILTWVPSPLTE